MKKGGVMGRRVGACGLPAVLLAALLSACATAPSPPPLSPQTFGGAPGSALGTYESEATGEMMASPFLAQYPTAAPCPVFIWDRPLMVGGRLVVWRLRAAACPVPGTPFFADVDLGGSIVPLAQSVLATGIPQPPPPDLPPTAARVTPRPAVTRD